MGFTTPLQPTSQTDHDVEIAAQIKANPAAAALHSTAGKRRKRRQMRVKGAEKETEQRIKKNSILSKVLNLVCFIHTLKLY